MRACPCQTLDKLYQDAFEHELEMLKERVRSSAQTRMENAVKELEEEEIQKRLGPGDLDPVEVYESLPKVGHTCRHSGVYCKLLQHFMQSHTAAKHLTVLLLNCLNF